MYPAYPKKGSGPNWRSEKKMTPESNVLVSVRKTFPYGAARAPQPCRTAGD